jgi:cytochrome c biogenesis protein CcmG/thiol:disulfide interchange protein DsbE
VNRASLFVPLAVFAVLAILFWVGLGREDPHKLPSALLDQPFPAFSLPRLDSPSQLANQDALRGQVHLVNVCPTCKAEHAYLNELAQREKIAIVGVNYKDDPAEAAVWIQRFGNPYVWTVIDADGKLGVDLGVYGAPETFLVDAQGVIRFKWVGDVNERVWNDELKPRLLALQRGDA